MHMYAMAVKDTRLGVRLFREIVGGVSFQELIISLAPYPDKRLHNQELVLGRLLALICWYWLPYQPWRAKRVFQNDDLFSR